MNKATSSAGRSILRGMLWVSGFVFLAKLAGAFKEMAVAAGFGTAPAVDGYLLAFNIANYPIALALGVVSIVLVPLAARLQGADKAELHRFRSELLGWTLAVGGLVGVGILLCAPLLPLLVQGQGGLIGEGMLQVLALVVPFGLLSSLLASWMLAAGRHLNTLLEAVPSLVLLLALLLLEAQPAVLVWGTVLGFAVQTGVFIWFAQRAGEFEVPRLSFKAQAWTDFRRGFGVMLFAQALTALLPLLDQFFCGSLGDGAISTLGYANRIMALLLGLGATSLSRACLPVLSEVVAKGEDLRGRLGRWVLLIVVASAVCAGVAALLAPLGVRLLFERGAFTPEDSVQVTEVLRWSLIQMPAYFVAIFMFNVMAATQRHAVLIVVILLGIAAKALAYSILIGPLGLNGVVLSTVVMHLFSALCLCLYFFWNWKRK